MKTIYGEKLPEGIYMGLLCEEGNGGSMGAIGRFENRHGYMPTEVILGKGAAFDAEDWGFTVVNTGMKCQPKHIMLR